MNPGEYAIMRAAEDRHWWYRGLRGVIRLHWSRHVPADPPPRLLDVGCGTGANLAALAPDCALAAGVDFAQAAVQACRGRGLAVTAAASAAALPFAAASFDVVLSCDVICHRSLPDRRVPLAEMARVLRPGGVVMLNLPAFQWLHSAHDEAYGQDRRFTRDGLAALLRATGFEVLATTYWNSLLFPAAAAARLWRLRSGRGGSDLAGAAGSGRVPAAILAFERRLLALTPLPLGLSVFAVGRKAG